jgi:hypothetical protein
MQNVGAISIIYEEQKNSSIEMIKSFRNYNSDSSIVIYCDGIVSDIDKICSEYNCECVIFPKKIGYPASYDVVVPLEYLYRFLYCSKLIKENYYINLEPDCLVTGNLQIENNTNSILFSPCPPMWSYYFYGNDDWRNTVMFKVFELYEKHNIKIDGIFDLVVGGGGSILNKNFFIKMLDDWTLFKKRTFQLKEIYDLYPCDDINKKNWFQDYILSLNIPFYYDSNYSFKDDNLCAKHKVVKNIIHPFKNYYK